LVSSKKLLVGMLAAVVLLGLIALVFYLDREELSEGRAASAANKTEEKELAQGSGPSRIVSLTPTITETLFALGAGERVVGVTRFCNYPSEAATRTKVGGLIDINIEAVVALTPDLVIAEGQQAVVSRLRDLGLDVLTVKCATMADLLTAVGEIGARVGLQAEAEALVTVIRRRTGEVIEALKEVTRPRVLLVVGRHPLVVAGRGTFMDELIGLAGGTNVMGDSERQYPIASMETVLLRRPEVIVECSGSMTGEDATEEARHAWSRWPSLPAVSTGRVYVSHSDALLRPGPRVPQALDELVGFFHPSAARDLGRAPSGAQRTDG